MEHPRFSWICDTDMNKMTQVYYHIKVGTEIQGTDLINCVWDSGIVYSDETVNIPYGGEKLATAETYYYRVLVGASDGNKYFSEIGTFTMGILSEAPWKAEWLGAPLMELHAAWFRKIIKLEKEAKKAYIYVASPNYYTLSVNGKRCGDSVLNNAVTDTSKTILYATYTVEDKIINGENVIGVELGNGWNGLEMSVGNYGMAEHLFSLQMYIIYKDGTSEWIYSKRGEWHFTTEGPITFNSIYDGEIYNACLEVPGWDEANFNMNDPGIKWSEAVEFEPPEGNVRSQILEPIKVVEHKEPVHVYKLKDGSYTFDMGQNFAGWAKLKIQGERGTEIKLSYAELINEDYTLNTITLRGVKATDTYILKGEGIEEYEPRYTYHGFRYVQVYGLIKEPEKDTILGCVVRSAVEQIGNFKCSNDLINQLHSNIIWTEASNLYGIPTDCPQRDERLAWLNDMTVRNEGAIYNFRLPQLYAKWLQDIRDTQGKVTGAITDTAPFIRYGQRPADPVSASFLLIPWNIYCHYRDKKIIEENYEPMKRWIAYLKRNSTDYIMRYSAMGDWAAPIIGTDMNSVGGGAVSSITPTQLMATGYFYYDNVLMAKMAEVLGKDEDVAYFIYEAKKVKEAFQKKYFNSQNGYYYSNSQACNTLPLYLNIANAEDREDVLYNLTKDIVENNNTHLTTGNLCSRYIIEVLFTNGFEDLAYELLTQTTYPSWGYMVENGATTMWERWEHVYEESTLSNMASHSHPMNGSFGVSFYKYLAGINIDEQNPGFKNIIISPIIPKKLKSAEASVDTIRGLVASSWKVEEPNTLIMNIKIPFNCTGEIIVPFNGIKQKNVSLKIGDELIYKNGVQLQNTACSFVHQTDTNVSLKVNSGSYQIIREGI